MAGSPLTHGPHWPALSPANQRAIRALSARPQASDGGPTRRRIPSWRRRRAAARRRRGPAPAPQPASRCRNIRRATPPPESRRRRPSRGPWSAASPAPPRTRPAARRRRRRSTARCPVRRACPAQRNQSAPNRAIRATWARVSTLCTRVGRPPIPRSNGRGGVVVGLASPPFSQWMSAVSSPTT